MENQVKNFFLGVKSRFPNIQFEVVHNSLSPSLTHFVLRDHDSKGFGGANNPVLAAQKAYSEFIERKTMRELNKMFSSFRTSNGFAAHFDRAEAIMRSRFELIERDAFLLSWHGKQAPYWLGETELVSTLSPVSFEIFNLHKKNNLDLKIGIVAKSDEIFTAISCVRMSNNRFYIDTKSGDNLPGMLNDLVESISFNSHYIIKGYSAKAMANLTQPIHHFDYYIEPRKGLDWFFKGSDEIMDLPLEKIVTTDCGAKELLEIKTDRYVYFSESPNMQEYYCGKASSKSINLDRFKRVFGRNFQFNKQVHPLS